MNYLRRKLILTALTVFCLGVFSFAKADTVIIVGNANSTQSTAQVEILFNNANQVFYSITNTSPGTSTITGVGFDLIAGDFTGNNSSGLNGFTGAQNGAGSFTFSDAALGSVPQFNNAVLDFGFTTGPDFAGGSPNSGILPGQTGNFNTIGNFQGLSLTQIANAIYVRFQNTPIVGSDVAHPGGGLSGSPVPEPATIILLGSGVAGLGGYVRKRRNNQ